MRDQKEFDLHSLRAGRQPDLVVVAQFEGELRHGGVAPSRLRFQAAQDDLLQPERIILSEAARRFRILPKPPFHHAQPLALAERPHARGEEIKENAKRKLVAARVVPGAQKLLGRHIGRGAVGKAELFLHEIRELQVMGQPVVDEHGFARGPEQNVARLDVEVDHMLAMDVVECGRELPADFRDLLIRQWQIRETHQERFPRNPLHNNVRVDREISRRNELRDVEPGDPRHDHLLHLEADDRRRVLPFAQHRHLHEERHVDAGLLDAPKPRHAAPVDQPFHHKAVENVARL